MPDSDIETPLYGGIEDFTFFKPQQSFDPSSLAKNKKKQWDATIQLRSIPEKITVRGRLNASHCYGGEFVSCSFRANEEIPDTEASYHVDYDPTKSAFNPERPSKPKEGSDGIDTRYPSMQYLSSIETLCDLLFKRVFPVERDAHGLVIIAGATATGKSQIARGLIYKYLLPLVPPPNSVRRRPHLITCEDPIDRFWADDPSSALRTGVDYTPRELGRDVDSIKDSINAALRQTPKVLFVGEMRNPEDWSELLRFASSGHLVVTTTHAGSLTEAMGEVLRAVKATSPSLRSDVANRILALVHLRSSLIRNNSTELMATLPAIWVRSAMSINTLMADGLTSLLPYRDGPGWEEDTGHAGKLGCLGRSWFSDRLLERVGNAIDLATVRELRNLALRWDMEGV